MVLRNRAPIRRPRPILAAGVVALTAGLLAGLLAGCSSDDLTVDRFDVTAAGRADCPELVADLPDRVADGAVVPVGGSGKAYAAAWGDPAIVLRCGVGKPADYDKFASCQNANGVDWFVPERIIEDQDADVVMTTIGRSPAVEVRVPASYRPGTAAMVDLADAIKAHTRELSPCL